MDRKEEASGQLERVGGQDMDTFLWPPGTQPGMFFRAPDSRIPEWDFSLGALITTSASSRARGR